MSYDPRTIAIALEDLVQEIGLWSVSASQTLSVAEHVQRHVRESAERTFHHAAVVVSEAQQDGDRVTKLSADASALVDQGETGKVHASATLSEARQVLDAASSTLDFWEEELRKALAWLARAEARLARAIDEYERARRAFEQAQWNLERAQSRYNACQRDKNRSNCNTEARAVNSAQEELQRAAYRLQIAEAEVIAAREEVAAARARVNCCSNAVQYATKAVSVAHEGETLAEQTVNSVERSLEFATAAAQNTAVACDKVAEEIAAAEEMMVAARGAISTTDEAANRLSEADRAEELAQRYARGGGREIEYRLGLLHEINRPDLQISMSGPGDGSGVVAGVAITGQTSAWTNRGIQFVRVEDLPAINEISGPPDFNHATLPEVRSLIEKLQEMLPVIESGTGANSDYWSYYDAERGLAYQDGYKKVYESFFGNDCIKVNKDGDSYDIDSGRHRIWMAKQMHVEKLPMRVEERNVNE